MPISSFPPAPSRSDPSTFADKADAYLAHLESPFVAEANALESNVNAKEASAVAASNAAVAVANAPLWVSGTTYALGFAVYDPNDFLTYRRAIAGAGTTRPGLDGSNWVRVVGTGNARTDQSQTFTGVNTFSQPIGGSVSGSASTASSVTNGVYTIGDQTIGGTKTFSALVYGSIRGSATCGEDALSGYVSGAGGGVTQLTSKSTTVTINKPSGIIVTHNQALAAGASVSFAVVNSMVSVVDFSIVVAHPKSGPNYTVSVLGATSGGFTLRLTNITGGSLSEAVSIGFCVFSASSFS